MKKLRFILLISLLLAVGCTQNHGYIGRLFGSWYLYEMTENGDVVDIAIYGETFWSFQRNLVEMNVASPYGDGNKHYGSFTETDTELIFNFNHKYGDNAPGTAGYGPPTWMGLPGTDNVVLTYIIKENKRMALSYTNAEGTVYEYYLRKTY